MIRSPYAVQPKSKKDPAKEAIFNLHDIGKIVQELRDLKTVTEESHQAAQVKRDAEHQAQLTKIQAKIDEAHNHIRTITKGERGDTVVGPVGPRGESPAIKDVVEAILPHIPAPLRGQPGKDAPKVDVEQLKKDILKDIKLPTIDYSAIVSTLKEKKLVKVEHIDGLEVSMSGLRNHVAFQMRGGGDTVVAGAGITITNTTNGNKLITSTATGFSIIAVSGTVNDSNVAFAAPSQPTLLCINGGFYQKTGGAITWTYVAGAITLSSPVGTGGSIFGV